MTTGVGQGNGALPAETRLPQEREIDTWAGPREREAGEDLTTLGKSHPFLCALALGYSPFLEEIRYGDIYSNIATAVQ